MANVLRNGDLIMNVDEHRLTLKGERVVLPKKPFALLRLLLENQGKTIPHREILLRVWGPAHVFDVQYLRVCVQKLRSIIEDDYSNPAYVHTIQTVGLFMPILTPTVAGDCNPVFEAKRLLAGYAGANEHSAKLETALYFIDQFLSGAA